MDRPATPAEVDTPAYPTAPQDWRFALLAVITMGVLHGLLCRLRFLHGDAIVQVPLILRELDSSFCPRDFFLNANDGFSPRHYWIILMGWMARHVALPQLYFALTILSNTLIALVTYFFTDRVVNRGRVAPLVACAIVLAIEGIAPGFAAQLQYRVFVPAALGLALLLLSLWMALEGRFGVATVAAIIASLVHPLMGIVTGIVALASGGLVALIAAIGGAGDRREQWLAVGRAALSGAALALASWLLWFRHYEQNLIGSELFVDILGRLRAPMLYIPSQFFSVRVIDTVLFLAAAGMSLAWYRAERPDRRPLVRGIIIASVIVLLMQLGGYLFVEVWPIRQWAALQASRFMFIPKWFGIVLIAATISRLWERARDDSGESAGAWIMLAAGGRTHGAGLLVGHIAAWLARRYGAGAAPAHRALGIGLGFVAAVSLAAWGGHSQETALLAVLLAAALMLLSLGGWTRMGASIAAIGVISAVIAVNTARPLPVVGEGIAEMAPVLDMREWHSDLVGAADYARSHTPSDALFAGPPERPAFRTLARRALVVDFWSIPFSDPGMLKWYRRVRACYAPFDLVTEAPLQMDENWRLVSRVRLAAIVREYGADYALLYRETQTDLPVLYEDETFQIVDLAPLR